MLVAAWTKLDRSGFEFDSQVDYQLALLQRHQTWSDEVGYTPKVIPDGLHRPATAEEGFSDRLAAFPPVSPVAVLSSSPPSSRKSFKQAVIAPLKSHPLPATSSQLEKRLAHTELILKEHQLTFKALDRKAEALERASRKLYLVLYNVPDEDDTQELVKLYD